MTVTNVDVSAFASSEICATMVCNRNPSENGALGKKPVPGRMLLSVLNGNYSETSLAKMATARLEKLLTQLVSCTSEHSVQSGKKGVKCYRRPKWWPKDMEFKFPITELHGKTLSSLTWNKFLRRLVTVCSQFCNARIALVKWRQEETKENVEKRKRKTSGSPLNCTKKQKTENSNGRILRNKVLSSLNTNPVLFVRLYDILKTPPVSPPAVTQNDFLQQLGLQTKSDSKCSDRKAITPPPLRLAHIPHVPFSSDYGRIIISREKQPVLAEVHLRRLERLEWYTKDTKSPASTNSAITYPVSYDFEKQESSHTYKFPRRQYYQGDSTLHTVSFLKSLCKPLSVRLTRIDCPKTKKGNGVLRDLKVLIPRVNIKKIKVEKNNQKVNKNNPVVMLRRLRLKT